MLGSQLSFSLRLLLSVMVILNGCATPIIATGPDYPPPSPIVLLRINATVDDKPVDPLSSDLFELEVFNTRSRARFLLDILPASSKPEEWKNGWIYFAVRPGTYYLRVMPENTNKPIPGFWLKVVDMPLIYAGSLKVTCRSQSGKFGCSIEIKVANEAQLALAIAEGSLSKSSPLTTVLMQSYPLEILRDLVPLAVVTASPKSFESPVFLNEYNYLLKPGEGKSSVDPTLQKKWIAEGLDCLRVSFWCFSAFALAGIIHGVVVTAVTADQRAAERESLNRMREETNRKTEETIRKKEETISKWESCRQGLAQELVEFNPMDKFRLRVAHEMRKYGTIEMLELKAGDDPLIVAQGKGLRGLLQTEIREVGIQECKTGETFSVGVVTRTSLWDVAGKKVLYDTVLNYPANSESAQCRTIEAYCGESGRRVLREELSRTIDLAVKSAVQDVGLEHLQRFPSFLEPKEN